MIIDSFLYYNEAEIAEIRIHELKDVVDKFVVISGETTWQGNPNPYVFPEHLRDIADIEVHRVPFPKGQILWLAERYVRNHMGRILTTNYSVPGNRYIFSDADEIPRASVIAGLDKGQYALEIDQYYYNFENYNGHHDCMITGMVENIDRLYEQRFEWFRSPPGSSQPNPRDQRWHVGRRFPVIEGAGWEFSFFGDIPFIQNKINQYSHAEIRIPEYTDAERIKHRMEKGIDIIDREKEGSPRGPLPQYVLDNKEKFAHFWRSNEDNS